ncbi:MAG: hypothetical protein RDV48_00500 [Candidatus Eremiobacteraeota bacterium]|nr:hypothetical protein [Candidatus Eremiobacteraeota bacterium]
MRKDASVPACAALLLLLFCLPLRAETLTFSADSSAPGSLSEFTCEGTGSSLRIASVAPGVKRLRIVNAADNEVIWDGRPVKGMVIKLPQGTFRAYCWSEENAPSSAGITGNLLREESIAAVAPVESPTPAPSPTPVAVTPTPALSPKPVAVAPTPSPSPTPVAATPAPVAVTPAPVAVTPAPAPSPKPVAATPTPAPSPTPVAVTPTPAPSPKPVAATPAPSPSSGVPRGNPAFCHYCGEYHLPGGCSYTR